MKKFTCIRCGGIQLMAGGTSQFCCDVCKAKAGEIVGRDPQRQAHYLVARSIRQGTLAKPSQFLCADCGGKAIEYDHRDYAQPLVVAPVCRRCNLRRGCALGSPAHSINRIARKQNDSVTEKAA